VSTAVERKAAKSAREYISTQAASRVLGIYWRLVPRVCETAGVRSRRLPTLPVRWHRGDVEALAARSIIDPRTLDTHEKRRAGDGTPAPP
jgi:hypothetical protein